MGDRFEGLYLPPPSRPDKPLAMKTIIIPTSEYVEGRNVVLTTTNSVYTVALRHLVEQRPDWCWATIQIVEKTPREKFVPPSFADQAYENVALPIDEGQTISQPYVVALMTEALLVGDRHNVIEIGTGSGYQTAILENFQHADGSVSIPAALQPFLGGQQLIERHG